MTQLRFVLFAVAVTSFASFAEFPCRDCWNDSCKELKGLVPKCTGEARPGPAAPSVTACTTVPECNALCSGGNMGACVALGSMFENGFGTREDKNKAEYWYDFACRSGFRQGCLRVKPYQEERARYEVQQNRLEVERKKLEAEERKRAEQVEAERKKLMQLTATAAVAAWPSLSTPPPRTGGGEKDAAVVVALEDYMTPGVPDVRGAQINGRDWYLYLTGTRGLSPSRVQLVRDAEATREGLLDAAQKAASQVQPGGLLWFIFIGHGAPSLDGQEGVLVGSDAQQTARGLYARSLRQSELEAELRKGKQRRTLLVLDACFSGKSGAGQALAPGLQPLLLVKPRPAGPVTVLSAGTASQFAGPLPGIERPAFSYLLLGALRGWGDADGNGEVSAEEAVNYAAQVLAVAPIGRTQTPALSGTEPTLVLASRAREPGPRMESLFAWGESTASLEAQGSKPMVPPNDEELPGRPTEIELLIDKKRRLGDTLQENQNGVEAKKAYAEAVDEFDRRNLTADSAPFAAEAAASSAFQLAEYTFADFEQLKLGGTGNTLRSSFSAKKEGVKKLDAAYDAVLKYNRSEWSVAAVYRKGQALERFSATILEVPVPADISRLGEHAVIAYRDSLASQTIPLQDKAVEAYELAWSMAQRDRLRNEWTKKTLESLRRLRPKQYGAVKEE